jgi:hypothetical protein
VISGSSIIATTASIVSPTLCPDGDTGCSVDQEVGNAGRENQWLHAAVVVGRRGVDGLLVDVAEHLGGDRREPRLGVPHGGGLELARAEVALSVDEGVARREVLRETYQRVVDGAVAVWVVVTHHGSDDIRALSVGPVGLQTGVVHREQDAAVNGLQAIPNVREGTPDDHAHRVVEIRGPHLVFQFLGLDSPVAVDAH